MGDKHVGGDRPGLDEIYCGPMDDITVGIELFYGEHKGEIVYQKVKASALLAFPVVSENPTVGHPLARLGDCGALLDVLLPRTAK